LITQKETADGQYAPNQHWLNIASHESEGLRKTLGERLSAFSELIDSMIERVKDRWIQIRDQDQNPDGLFAYDYDDDALIECRANADVAEDPDALIDILLDEFWQRTRRNLDIVRAALHGDLASELHKALSQLEIDIQRIVPSIGVEFRRHVANCRNEMQAELQTIVDWFAINEVTAITEYDLGVLVETVLTQIRRLLEPHSFEPQVHIVSDLVLRGSTFRPLVNIMYLLLHNVVKHARELRDTAALQIETDYDSLTIEVTNDLPAATNLVELRETVRTLEAHVRGEGVPGYVRQEGRSGYYKLGKLLKYDLKRVSHTVSTSVDEDRRFRVKITFELEGLTSERIDR
jgi:hypothetical protein